MRLHKHPRTIVAILLVLCVIIVLALHAQVPADAPTQPAEQRTPTESTEQPTEPLASTAPTTKSGQPNTTDAKGAGPARNNNSAANDSAANVTAANATASDDPANEPETNEETLSLDEGLQQQVSAAIPHVERAKVSPDAEYVPDVVLVSVREGTTAEQLSQAITNAGIKSVEPDDIEAITDDLMMARLTPSATIDDAIYELESTGVAKGAQPNYVYEIAEDRTPDSNNAEPATEVKTGSNEDKSDTADDATSEANESTAPDSPMTPDDSAASDSDKESDEPAASDGSAASDSHKTSNETNLSTEADATKEQPNNQSSIEVQSASSTAARDALNDADAKKQWDLDSIDAFDAWEFPPVKNATATVGVGIVDNGFNNFHEDLADNVQSTYNATTRESAPVYCPPGTPNIEHGMHVAGIVAATSNNEKGIGGVGFNHLKLSLVSLTSESDPSGISTGDVAAGFEYLINNKNQYNIRVANMSIGGKAPSLPDAKDDVILKKIDEAYAAGIVTVASAGNRTSYAEPPYINYPSDYDTVVSVINLQNTNSDDPKSVERRDGSNYNAKGETGKNISAPGTNIYSTYPNGYGEMSGTSMAAPHVAGVVGLMYAVNPMMSTTQAKNLLYSSARDIGAPGWDEQFGHGEVNASAAVRAAAAGTISGPEYLAAGSQATYTLGSDYTGWSFSSSDPGVLEVDEGGAATAVSAGIATVSASNGSSTVSQQVTVLGPITGNSLVAKDGSESLAITTPDGCGKLAWKWESSSDSVATVTDNGMVNGHAVGTATITATLASDSSVSLSYAITVYDALKTNVYVPMGGTTGGTTTLTPGTSGFNNPQISGWSSTNVQVATVDSDGKVTASSVGGAVVSCTITDGDKTATNVWCVYVYGPIAGASNVGIGQSTQLTVAGINNMPQEAQTGWTWSLGPDSSSEVATVSEDGVVTGLKLGTVAVTATRGQMSFSHEVQVTQATPISLADAKVTIPRQTYSGKKLTPVPMVTLNGATLAAGVDYEVVEQEIKNAGSHTVTIKGKGNYQGTATGVFVVEPKKLTPPKAKTGLVYNGQLQTGVPEGADYTLRNATGVDADDYFTTVEVKDKANTYWEDDSEDNTVAYRTSCRVEWSIAPRSASDVSATVPGSYVYNGSAQTPKPTVTWNGEALDSNDYTVSYANNVNAGTATVTITCEDGNFKGTKTASFSIAPAPIEGATVTLGDALTYTGKEQTQKVASVLVGGVDVKQFCDVSGNVVTDAGDYKLTITAKPGCNYTGSVTSTFSVKKAAPSVGTVTAADVKDSLDPADVTLTRSDTSIPGGLAITESQLSYGTNTYHWTFTPTDVNHESSSGTVEITVTGHEWGAPTYEWAEGNASCTARRVCANNPAHVEEETVIPERKVTAEPTTDVEGKATLTATFQNSAFEAQSKEVSLPKLLGPGRIGSSVTTRGDGSAVQMSVPDGLLESILTDDEKRLVAGGADASLVATVSWLGVGEAPKDDLALLAKDCKDRKTSLGWEAYLDVALHVRIGDEERSLTKTDKPIAFEVKLDPEGKDPISKEYAQAVADGKVEGSVTVRRVHDGTVSEVGSAKKGETITFASDQFSTFALGSAAKEDASPTYGSPKAGGDSTGSPVQSSPSTATSSSSIGSSTTTRLANTSDNTSSVVPAAIAGAIALALAALKRKIHNR